MQDWFLFFLAGSFAGIMSGLLGIGGGLVIVPTLSYLFHIHMAIPDDVVMHLASGTSLCIMIFTSAVSVFSNKKKSKKAETYFREAMPYLILGIIVGAFAADFMSTGLLKKIFGVFVLFVAAEMLFGRMIYKSRLRVSTVTDRLIVSFIGACSGLLGVGGSVLLIPYLSRRRMQLRTTTKVSALSSLTAGVIGTIVVTITGLNDTYHHEAWSFGYVYLPAVLFATVPSMLFAKIAAKQAPKISIRYLRTFFIIFLLLTGLRMIW